MANASDPGLNLFIDILIKLEELEIPYAIIGGFAATMYGITRATFDIDIIVDLKPTHIQARTYGPCCLRQLKKSVIANRYMANLPN